MLRFFSYIGSKKTLAPELGPPRRNIVVEPFAGSAGYSVHWQPARVVLIEADPAIAGIWQWLLDAKPGDVMDLPDAVRDVDADMQGWPEGAKSLVGFWLKHVSDRPARRATASMVRDQAAGERWAWRPAVKRRIAEQLHLIRDWRIVCGNYDACDDDPELADAHWHVDPPYQHLRGFYGASIDYEKLGAWCRTKSCIDVCERDDATWLPFASYRSDNGSNQGKRYRTNSHYEVLWSKGRDGADDSCDAYAGSLLVPEA